MSSETNTPNIDSVTAWLAKRLSEKHDTATTVSMFRRKLTDLLEKRERELAATQIQVARIIAEKSQ